MRLFIAIQLSDGIGGDDNLLSYVKRLRRALAGNGIPFDRKKFSPHITLIRRAEYDRRRSFPGITVPDVSMQVSGISLMRSDRTKSGMVYTGVGAVTIYSHLQACGITK